MKLTNSLGLSFNQVSAELGPGGLFEGFRHATYEEVEALWLAAGITLNNWSNDEEYMAKCEAFANLLGPTNVNDGYYEVMGFTGTQLPDGLVEDRVIYMAYSNWTPGYVAWGGGLNPNIQDPTYGNWLVREANPQAMLQELANFVMSLNINHGISNSFDAKLEAALGALDDINENNDVAAINSLNAFINAAEAQRGKELTDGEADNLISKAQAIINLLSQ